MNDPEFEKSLQDTLRAEAARDGGFWARQRAEILGRLPAPRPAWRRWGWAPAAAFLTVLLLWPRRPAVPPVSPDMVKDMELLQNLDMAQDLEIVEDLDDAEVGL